MSAWWQWAWAWGRNRGVPGTRCRREQGRGDGRCPWPGAAGGARLPQGRGQASADPRPRLPGRRDSSGIRLYYTASLRRFDAGIMELGLVYTPVMAIPPQEEAFVLTGYCTDKCTQLVSGAGPGAVPKPLWWGLGEDAGRL